MKVRFLLWENVDSRKTSACCAMANVSIGVLKILHDPLDESQNLWEPKEIVKYVEKQKW